MTYRLHKAIWNPGSNNPILGLSPAAYYPYAEGITVTGAGVSMWADQADSDNSLVLPGVEGNYASTPDSAAFPTSDIDVRVRVALDDWTPSTTNMLVSKLLTAGQYCFDFYIAATTGVPVFRTSNDGTTLRTATSSAAPTFTDGSAYWIRVTRAAASGDVKFYTAANSATEPTSWTQLGTTQSTTAEGIKDGTGACYVGEGAASANFSKGKFYRAAIYSTIGGTTPVFDADFSAQAKGTTSFSESSSNGATVTVNQSGALPAHIGSQKDLLQGTDGNRPAYSGGVITFDGVDNYLKTNAFTLNQPETIYLVVNQLSWTAGDYMIDSNSANSGLIAQSGSSPNLVFSAGSNVPFTGEDAAGSYTIICAVINGASSAGQIRLQSEATGNVGAGNMGGITLGSNGSGSAAWSNIAVKEAAIFPAAHDAATRSLIISYLMAKFGIT